MIVGTRTLTVKTKTGERKSVAIRLYSPTLEGDVWDCRYEIDWPDDGWPAQLQESHAQGSDALHALQLAMQKIGVDLHTTSYHEERAMWWIEGVVGYGFAVDKNARDLLIGDDARLYG